MHGSRAATKAAKRSTITQNPIVVFVIFVTW
jgi:hypothetical protein